MDGLLLVDKPRGITSHDVVWRVRRAVRDRTVGHAGTLDPMATGLLVVLLGKATRLSAWLTLDRKRYVTTVRFGATTASLDADGAFTERMPEGAALPSPEAVREAVARRVGPMLQVPPAVSAIKVDGVAMHERARRGEEVALDARPVTLERAEVLAVREGECDLDLTVSKGFYVRSFARDLAADLGTLGYLTALRRTESGVFTVDEALDPDTLDAASRGDRDARERVVARVAPLASASRAMRSLTVDANTAIALGHGKRVPCEADEGVALVLSEEGAAVCVANVSGGVMSVARGFGGT
jgi:tRNA pseudouridine55 synthase